MSAQHGALFSEIGRIVFDAHKGEAIDLDAKAEELAARYPSLGLSAEAIARAIARSAGAVGVSLALVAVARTDNERLAASRSGEGRPDGGTPLDGEPEYAVLPSGLRVAILS